MQKKTAAERRRQLQTDIIIMYKPWRAGDVRTAIGVIGNRDGVVRRIGVAARYVGTEITRDIVLVGVTDVRVPVTIRLCATKGIVR